MKRIRQFAAKNRQAIRNTFFSATEATVQPLFGVILIYFFIAILGAEDYGVYVLVGSFSSLLTLSGSGIGITLMKFIAEYRGKQRFDKIKSLSGTLFIFQIVCSSLLAVVLISSMSLIIPLLFSNAKNVMLIKEVLWFAIPTFAIDLLDSNFSCIHKGYERFGTAMFMNLSFKIVRLATQLIVILCTKDIVLMYKITLITAILFTTSHAFICRFLYRDIAFFSHIKLSALKEVFSFSSWAWLMTIVYTVTNPIDKWLVAGISDDLSVVGYYSIGLSIFMLLSHFSTTSTTWVFTKISYGGITERMKRLYVKGNYLILIAIVLVVLFLFAIGDFVFGLWLGDKFVSAKIYIYLFISLCPIIAQTSISGHFILATGKIKQTLYIYIANVCAQILSMYLLLTTWGVTYGILSYGIAYSITGLAYQYYARIAIEDNSRAWKSYLYVFLSILISVIMFFGVMFTV